MTKHWSNEADPNMWYRANWYTMKNPKKEYHSKWSQYKEGIKAWVKLGNTLYPQIIHYMRYMENPPIKERI